MEQISCQIWKVSFIVRLSIFSAGSSLLFHLKAPTNISSKILSCKSEATRCRCLYLLTYFFIKNAYNIDIIALIFV